MQRLMNGPLKSIVANGAREIVEPRVMSVLVTLAQAGVPLLSTALTLVLAPRALLLDPTDLSLAVGSWALLAVLIAAILCRPQASGSASGDRWSGEAVREETGR